MHHLCFDNMDLLTEEWLAATLPSASSQRQAEVMKYKFLAGRVQSLKAYDLLRECLVAEFDYPAPPLFTYSDHGKPSIEGRPDIFFSMSHCRAAVASVASHTPVGIDVEAVRSVTPALMRHVLSPEEAAEVERSAWPELTFVKFWTMKESLVKLTGLGIGGHSLPSLLSEPFARSVHFDTTVNEEKGYVMTVCY